jgi:YVTN family beta-propeller protein
MHYAVILAVLLCQVVTADQVSADGDWQSGFVWQEVERGTTVECPFYAQDATVEIDPGEDPEGDYMFSASYTGDGGRILVCNYMTQNITVFDAATMAVLQNIDIDGMPGRVACSDSYAVVSIPFGDRVDILDLSDYSLAGQIATGEQPWEIRISPDGSHAYVGCDIDDVCEVVNLQTLSHERTIGNFPVFLVSFGFNSESPRVYYRFSSFQVTHDEAYLIAGNWEDSLTFFNTQTGLPDYALTVSNCTNVNLSGDGNYAVAMSSDDPVVIHRVDISGTPSIDTSVPITGYTCVMTRDMAVDQAGSKALVSTSSNTNSLVRFATQDFLTFSSTYSAFWMGVSHDHTLAISGQYRFSVIDFASETLVGQHMGNSQYMGCVSPVSYSAAGCNPLMHEGLYFYDYSSSSPPVYLGTTLSGASPEGDAPRRVAVSPDGSAALTGNTMSDNSSVIDIGTGTVEAILPIGDRVQGVAITPGSDWGVVCGFNSNSVHVIDLATNTEVAAVPTGTRPGVVALTPDGQYAYVGNISSNTVSVVHLDGASSSEVAEISCGIIGVVWAAYGVSSDVEMSPAGDYCLVAASFDDRVKVIDTATNQVVADLVAGDFPIQIAINSTGDRAIVSNYFSDDFSLIDIAGASSSVIGTFSVGDAPLRVAYCEVQDLFAVGNYSDRNVKLIDPDTGTVVSVYPYSGFGSLYQVDFTSAGELMVLTAYTTGTSATLHVGSVQVPLPATGTWFDYCESGEFAAVAVPGPDNVVICTWTPGGTEGGSGGFEPPLSIRTVSGNPASGPVGLELMCSEPMQVSVSVFDITGRIVAELLDGDVPAGSSSLIWNRTDSGGEPLPAGIYTVRALSPPYCVAEMLTLIR